MVIDVKRDITENDYNNIKKVIEANYYYYKRENYDTIINELKKYYKGNYENFTEDYNSIGEFDTKEFNKPDKKDVVYVKRIIKICFDIFKSDEDAYKYYIICYVIYWLYFEIINKYDNENHKQNIKTNFKHILLEYEKDNNYWLLNVQIYQTNKNLLELNCNIKLKDNLLLYNIPYIFYDNKNTYRNIYKNDYIVLRHVKIIAKFETLNYIYINNNIELYKKLVINDIMHVYDDDIIPPNDYVDNIYLDCRILES